jgi:hypothetical protein
LRHYIKAEAVIQKSGVAATLDTTNVFFSRAAQRVTSAWVLDVTAAGCSALVAGPHPVSSAQPD